MASKVTPSDHTPPNDAFTGALLKGVQGSVLDFYFYLLLFTHGKQQLRATNRLDAYAFSHFLQPGSP